MRYVPDILFRCLESRRTLDKNQIFFYLWAKYLFSNIICWGHHCGLSMPVFACGFIFHSNHNFPTENVKKGKIEMLERKKLPTTWQKSYWPSKWRRIDLEHHAMKRRRKRNYAVGMGCEKNTHSIILFFCFCHWKGKFNEGYLLMAISFITSLIIYSDIRGIFRSKWNSKNTSRI